MDILFGLIVVVHLIGMAAIVGSWMSTIRAPRVLPGMVHGALTQLVTGVLMVGLVESGAIPDRDGDDLNMTKLLVKLSIALVVAAVAWVNRRRADEVSPAVFHAIGGLALLNVLIAVLWS